MIIAVAANFDAGSSSLIASVVDHRVVMHCDCTEIRSEFHLTYAGRHKRAKNRQ